MKLPHRTDAIGAMVGTFSDIDEEGPRAISVLVWVCCCAVPGPQGEWRSISPEGEPCGRDVLPRAKQRSRGGYRRVHLYVLILQQQQQSW